MGLLQVLDLQPGERALEVGLGTGYNAALMSHLVTPVGRITSIDPEEILVRGASDTLTRLGIDNVLPIASDGWLGDHESAPFDAILATVGVGDISPHWAEQLRDGGRLLVPLFLSVTVRQAVLFERNGDRFVGRALGTQRYVMLRGQGHDDLGGWVIVGEDYWSLPRASHDAWEVLSRLLAEGPTVEEPFPIEEEGWLSWPTWLGLEDPQRVIASDKGQTGLLDVEAGGLAVVDPSDRFVRSYGDRGAYDRLIDLVVRRRPASNNALVGRTMAELTVEAVPSGSATAGPDGWMFTRENFEFVVRLPARAS